MTLPKWLAVFALAFTIGSMVAQVTGFMAGGLLLPVAVLLIIIVLLMLP